MSAETDALKKDIDELRETLEKVAKDVSTVSAAVASDIEGNAASKARQVREEAQRLADNAVEAGRQSGEAVADSVRRNPLQSMLIAFGTGLMIALFFRIGAGKGQ